MNSTANRREDRHIIRKASVHLTATSATIQAKVACSLAPPVSSRTIERCLAAALDAHPSTPPFGVVPRSRKLDCSGMEPGRL
ncbi:hypothetical protein TNCV_4018821 [Trichonephila clavipes]|nr:hypothetical protein TNCV_4018821 [Trichonephila clavipes]